MKQKPQLPQDIANPAPKHPVVIIGAGTVVEDAHLPAYRQLGLEIAGMLDSNQDKALMLARRYGINTQYVFQSVHDCIQAAPSDAVFDIASPPATFMHSLDLIPDKRAVLIQKPMGESLEEAYRIEGLCRQKSLTAAVNFQLRYAPAVLGANRLIAQGSIGSLVRVDLMATYPHPSEWDKKEKDGYDSSRYQWEFVKNHPHSHLFYSFIHLLDLLCAFLGEPVRINSSRRGVPVEFLPLDCRTLHLSFPEGREARVAWFCGDNPAYRFTVTGETGRIRISFPVRYPNTGPDTLAYSSSREGEDNFEERPVDGAWFPEAFRGPMAALQCRCNDPRYPLPTSVHKALQTMVALDAVVSALDRETVTVKR